MEQLGTIKVVASIGVEQVLACPNLEYSQKEIANSLQLA